MFHDADGPHVHIPHPRVGMRTVKTVLAVFLSCVIDFLRGASPIQSTIAAILCIQPNPENSVDTALNRTFGTLLGGYGAAVIIVAIDWLHIPVPSLLFYFILSVLLMPLIYIPVRLGRPNATALTCIVFLVVGFSHTPGAPVFVVASHRVLDTMVGILVALPVNMFLPSPPAHRECGDEDAKALSFVELVIENLATGSGEVSYPEPEESQEEDGKLAEPSSDPEPDSRPQQEER